MRSFPIVVLLSLAVAISGCAQDDATPDGTITVALDALDGFERLAVNAWVLPLEPTAEKQALGGAHLSSRHPDPLSASQVMHPQGPRYWEVLEEEIAIFEPGTYRFIIEAYVPSGAMHYGCERQIEVVDGESLVVTLSDMPVYTGDGFHWTPDDELRYPDCPD